MIAPVDMEARAAIVIVSAEPNASAKQLADQILRNVAEPNGSYCVHGWAAIGSTFLLALAGVAASYLGHELSNPFALAIGACLLLMAALCAIDVAPRLFKPMLLLTRDGLQTAEYGFIPWDQITGVRLESHSVMFCEMRTMEVSVPHRHELMSKAHPCARLLYDVGLYRRRNELRFALTQQRRDAQVIAIVAEYLWREKTAWGGRSVPGQLPPAAWISASAPQPQHHQPRAS
jgi:hypothetical protein